MGLEGAVRLGLRKELEAIEDEGEREQRVREMTAAAERNAQALNAAQLFEIDDVIDPAETRDLIAATLGAAGPTDRRRGHRFVDTWSSRRLRSQGTLQITDLDADPEHRDCATDGLNQWGGLPVTRLLQ